MSAKVETVTTNRWQVALRGDNDDTVMVNSIDGSTDVKLTLGRVQRVVPARDWLELMDEVRRLIEA